MPLFCPFHQFISKGREEINPTAKELFATRKAKENLYKNVSWLCQECPRSCRRKVPSSTRSCPAPGFHNPREMTLPFPRTLPRSPGNSQWEFGQESAAGSALSSGQGPRPGTSPGNSTGAVYLLFLHVPTTSAILRFAMGIQCFITLFHTKEKVEMLKII